MSHNIINEEHQNNMFWNALQVDWGQAIESFLANGGPGNCVLHFQDTDTEVVEEKTEPDSAL